MLGNEAVVAILAVKDFARARNMQESPAKRRAARHEEQL
jgi:hypothetical protein